MRKIFVIAILLVVLVSPAKAANLELRIPCKIDAEVKAVMPAGEVVTLGKVLMTPVKTNWPAYTASKWCEPSTVCASAVNAIHILVNVSNDRGRIISLVPSVTVAPAAERGSFFSLDMPAGTGIFGGFAPFVGSSVRLLHEGIESPLIDVPKEDDVLIIRSDLTQKFYMLDIENRPAGRVIAHGTNGPELIARVVHKVSGVGRFAGSLFQENGRVRASHAGIIDIATSKRNTLGGMQIIPLKHALTSLEMKYVWNSTQWLIISPLPGYPDLEGHEPLYKHSFIPGAQLQDKLPDLWSQYGRKPLVLCRRDGGAWEKLPEVSGRIDDALKDVTHLRLYFPTWSN